MTIVTTTTSSNAAAVIASFTFARATIRKTGSSTNRPTTITPPIVASAFTAASKSIPDAVAPAEIANSGASAISGIAAKS